MAENEPQKTQKPEKPTGPETPEIKPADPKREILDRLLKIEAAFPCKSAQAWTDLLKVPFSKKGSGKGVAVYEAAVKPTSFLTRVELKADFAGDASRQALTVELAQPAPVTAADFDAALKAKAQIDGAAAVWSLRGKKIRAGFESAKLDMLVSFAVDSLA